MPNRRTHDITGAVLGTAAACYIARNEEPSAFGWEVFGGTFAGLLASRFPDVFDPPVSPIHRGLAHGAVPNGAWLVYAAANATEWQTSLRQNAGRFAQLRTEAQTASGANWYLVLEILCRVATGAIPGALAGYTSHLFLDAQTKKGLPVIY